MRKIRNASVAFFVNQYLQFYDIRISNNKNSPTDLTSAGRVKDYVNGNGEQKILTPLGVVMWVSFFGFDTAHLSTSDKC